MKDKKAPKSHKKTYSPEKDEKPRSIFDRWSDSDDHISLVRKKRHEGKHRKQ